jgi:septal ring factor EnvC (AmiA/AmiB activator)
MAQARRISHEQLTQTAKDWQDIATARTERVNLLQQQQASLQAQITDLTGRIAAVEKDRDYLVRKNLDLSQALDRAHDRVEQLEQALCDHGLQIPRLEERTERNA